MVGTAARSAKIASEEELSLAWEEGADPHSGFNIDLGMIAAIIRRNLLLIAAVVGAALLLGIIATMLMTPRYTASSSIQIDQQADRVLQTEDVQPVVGAQDADRFLQTQTDLLKSRAIADRVATRFSLMRDDRFLIAMGSEPIDANGLSPQEVTAQRRTAVQNALRDNLDIELPRNSRVVQIAFTSPSPELAARVANGFAEEFIQSNLSRRYDSSSYARTFLSQQLAEAKTRLEQSERRLNEYARQANLIDTGGSTDEKGSNQGQSVTTASLVQLNQAASTARAQRVLAEQKWRTISETPLFSIPEVVSNTAVQQLLTRRAEITGKLGDERTRHLADHPSVKQLEAQLADISRELTTLATGIKRSLRDGYVAAMRQDEGLQGQVEQFSRARLAEQDRAVQYRILQRDADTNRSLYDGLLQRFREVSAAAGVSTNNISVVDTADTPSSPSSPKLLVNLALALAAGLVLAGLAVLAREQLDDSIRMPEDVTNKLELTTLGVLPMVKRGQPLEELARPRSALSEAYNALRTSLQYSGPDGVPRRLFVTSAQAGEGKSTTSFAIATSFARLGLRVLLVDIDLRRPAMHRFLETDNENGLSTVLTGQSTVAEQVRTTGYESLFFLPAGPIPPNPTELLGSERLSIAIHELSEGVDLVLFDGPPVLGLADAPMLAGMIDATIFIIEANRKRRGGIKNSLRRLRAVRANLLGGVLVKFDPGSAGLSSSYGSYYSDYYAYGSENKSGD